jgi:hypothetical protein
MARSKTNTTSAQPAKRRRVGSYLCHACGNYIERQADDRKPLKKWRKSYCQQTGQTTRIYLQR